MTDKTPMAPTDAELDELRQANGGKLNFVTFSEFRTVARAVLAKWGTQPVACAPLTDSQAQAVNQSDRPFIVRLAEDFAEECVTAGYVTTKAASYGRLMNEALSTQAQAGAVPLTDEQIEAIPLWKRFVGLWPETRREIVRTIERHHGITGGQHGAE